MSDVRIPANATAASLVGSLSVFTLLDVLDLLSRTSSQGELEVVSAGIDVRLWVDDGCLVEDATAAPEAATARPGPGGESPTLSSRSPILFESACADTGWFYFTEGASLPAQTTRQPLTQVLAELGPSVAEWRELVAELPAMAIVRMADATPSDDVQIKASDWKLLSLVGNNPNQTIRHFLDSAGVDPLELLRTLHGLQRAGLIEADTSVVAPVATPAEVAPAPAVAPAPTTPGPAASVPPAAAAPPPPPPPPPPSMTTVAAADPASIEWTTESAAAHEADLAMAGARPAVQTVGTGDPLPPFFPPGTAAAEPMAEATVASAEPAPAPPPPPTSVMPPPITGDPWANPAGH